MPLNSMKTWVDGVLVNASDLNAEIRDPVNALTPGHQVLTTTAKNALTGVTTGTMVYDSTLGVMQTWNGSAWVTPFPFLYSSGTTGNITQGNSFDFLWPALHRNVVITLDMVATNSAPAFTWQFLSGGTPLSAASYGYVTYTLGTTYSATQTSSATSVSLILGQQIETRIEVTVPQSSGSIINPFFRMSGGSTRQTAEGNYGVLSLPTGIRITETSAGGSYASFAYRIIVNS